MRKCVKKRREWEKFHFNKFFSIDSAFVFASESIEVFEILNFFFHSFIQKNQKKKRSTEIKKLRLLIFFLSFQIRFDSILQSTNLILVSNRMIALRSIAYFLSIERRLSFVSRTKCGVERSQHYHCCSLFVLSTLSN